MILILKRESFSFANAKNSHLENFQKKAKAENAKAVFLPKPKLPKPKLQKSQRRFFYSENANAVFLRQEKTQSRCRQWV